MSQGLLAKIRAVFEGDPGVRKVADDPVLTAELVLLFRMMLTDGKVSEAEMEVVRRICRVSFGIPEESMEAVIGYLHDYSYETTGAQAVAMFRDLDIERRRLLARHLADVAKADAELSREEVRLLRRLLDLLELQPADTLPAEKR
mgnify:CR=1 FL=1